MKLRKQDTVAEENGTDKEKNNSTNFHLTDNDKEKGNFKNFNISKKTIQKLKGKIQIFQ
jgi:hypothetical protein